MNNDPNKPTIGPPNVNPILLNWMLQYQANQQQNSIMQSLLMNPPNLALQQMLQLAPPQLLQLQAQQMVMPPMPFFGFPPPLPMNNQVAQAPFAIPANKPVEKAKASTSQPPVQEPEKCLDVATPENAEKTKPTVETEPKESKKDPNEHIKRALSTAKLPANHPSHFEKPEPPPAPETSKKVEEPKPKRQRKRNRVENEEAAGEAPKRRNREPVSKEVMESYESIIARAKKSAEEQRREIRRQEALNHVWFKMPSEIEYRRFNKAHLKRLKEMAKKHSPNLRKLDENVPFFERHRLIFQKLRCQKIIIDIEKEEKRRSNRSDKNAPPTSSTSETSSEGTSNVFSDEVYQAFDIKTHANLCSTIRESFFQFNTLRVKETSQDKRKNLTLWLPKLTQIIKESERVFQSKFTPYLEKVNRKRERDRWSKKTAPMVELKPPMITDQEKETCGSNEECVKVLKLFHGLSGISFKPTNIDEVVQVRWISVRLKSMRTGKRRRYLKSVMKRIKKKISLPADYVPQKTHVSTRRLYRIMLEDYKNEKKFRNKKTSSSASSVGWISKYDMEVLKVTIERIKQMNYEEREAMTRRTRESDIELKMLLKMLNEHYTYNKIRKREQKSKNAEVLERSRSFPCMKEFEERIKWITEQRLTEILFKVQNTLRSLDKTRESRSCGSQNPEALRRLPYVSPPPIKLTKRDALRMKQLVGRFEQFVVRLQRSPENERTSIKEKIVQKVLRNERCYQFALDLISKIEEEMMLTAPPIEPGTGRPMSILERMLTRKSPPMYSHVKMLPLNWTIEDMGRLVESLKYENLMGITKNPKNDKIEKKSPPKKESESAEKVEEVARYGPEDTSSTDRLLPGETAFEMVGSRLNQGLDYKKYAITSDEMSRRIAGFEKLNSSNVWLHLRRAKEKRGGEQIREQLREKGVNIAFNKRQTIRATSIVSLCEQELQDLFKDMESFSEEYPAEELADELVTSFIDDNVSNVLSMGTVCDDVLKMMKVFSSILGSVVPPVNGHLPVSSGDKHLNYAMENFSHATHGFGIQSFQMWVGKSVETFKAITTHRRLRDSDGNRPTVIPPLEEAIEKSKELSSDELSEIIDEVKAMHIEV